MNQKSLINEFLILIGIASGSASITLQNIDLVIGILLKLTSLVTFFCYIIINHDNLIESYKKFKKRFFKK